MGLYQLQVFNRWGVEVYNSSGTPVEWDGRSNGVDLAEGVYFYVVEFEIVCDGLGRMTHSGYVQIVK
jgi:gliding motility-associated-like protein